MEKNTSMETASADTTMESLDRSDHPVKHEQQEEKMESGDKEENIVQPSRLRMESENPIEEDIKAIDSLTIKEETPIPIAMKDQIPTDLEIDSLTEIKTEATVVDASAENPEDKMDSISTDDNDNNVEIKEETENGEKEESKEDAEEGVEKTAAGNNSLVDDAVEMSAPVVAQTKVVMALFMARCPIVIILYYQLKIYLRLHWLKLAKICEDALYLLSDSDVILVLRAAGTRCSAARGECSTSTLNLEELLTQLVNLKENQVGFKSG